MKKFTRIEPTTVQAFGERFKRTAIIKRFRTEDGIEHEFTTWGKDGGCDGGVIALTPDRQVIISYQFRAGPERWMSEIPGGELYDDEDVQAGALRELKEETGYVPGRVEYLGESNRGAYTNTVWHYYLATDCVLAADGLQLDKEEHEQGAEVRLISIDELIDNAKRNRMSDPHAVLMAYDKLMALKENSE